jgi:hypothetical protein
MRQNSLLFQSVAVVLLLCCATIAAAAAHHNDNLEAKISVLTEHPIIGQPVMVKGQADDGTPPYTYSWNTSDNQNATGKTATFIAPLAAGPFTINLTVNDSSTPTPQTVTVTKNITVKNPPPLKAKIVSVDPDCPIIGQLFKVRASADDGVPPYTYSWNTSDNQNATGKTATFIAPLVAGPFTITLTVNDSNVTPQTVTVTKNITVKNPPQLKAEIDEIEPEHPVVGQEIEAEAKARGGIPPYTFTWNTSDLQNATGKEVTFTAPLTAGQFIINLTVNDSSPIPQSVTVTKNITVKNPPSLKAWIDDIDPECIAVGKKVEAEADVRGGTPPYNFTWNTSDGQVKYGKEVTFTAPSIAGPFIISLNVTDSGLPTPQTVTDSETVIVKTRCRK